MTQKGRLQFLHYEGVWEDSSYEGKLHSFVCDWLRGYGMNRHYRWVEGGVTVLLPRQR